MKQPLTIRQFAGLNRFNDETDLEPGEFTTFENVDFRQEGAIAPRDGIALVDTADLPAILGPSVLTLNTLVRPDARYFVLGTDSGVVAKMKNPDPKFDEDS